MDKVRKFKPPTDPICRLCGDSNEFVDHLFMWCKVPKSIWFMGTSSSGLQLDDSRDLIAWIKGWKKAK